jgi:hypothetical protein
MLQHELRFFPSILYNTFTFFVSTRGASTRLGVSASPYGASQSYSLEATNSVGLLWMSDQSDSETSTGQHTTLTRDTHPWPGGIRTHNPSN